MFDVRVQQYGRALGAMEFFERELMEQARGAGKAPGLGAIGTRFADIRPDAEGMSLLRERFRADGNEHPRGSFTFLRLDLDRRVAADLATVPPSRLDARLLRAAHETLGTLTQREGLYYLAREKGVPEVRAVLSPRRADGTTARTLGRTDVQSLQATWQARTHAAFHMRQDLEPSGDKRAIEDRWRLAVQDVQRAVGARMRNEIDQTALRSVLDKAEAAGREWRALPAAPEKPRETLALSIEGGRDYLAGLGAGGRNEALSEAARAAAGLRDDVEVAHVVRPDGDVKALVHLPALSSEQREAFPEALRASLGGAAARQPSWTPKGEPGRVSHGMGARGISVRLQFDDGQRILERVGPLPSGREGREFELGARFETHLKAATERALARFRAPLLPSYEASVSSEGAMTAVVRFETTGLPLSRARTAELRKTLEQEIPKLALESLRTEHGLRIPAQALHVQGRAHQPVQKMRKAERMGPGGDLHTMLFRVEAGIGAVSGLEIREQQALYARAAERALPGLMDHGFRPLIGAERQGDSLLIRVTVPHDYFVDRDLIPSPASQARFSNTVHRGALRDVDPGGGQGLAIREGRVAAERIPPSAHPSHEVLDRISRLVPAALHTGRSLLRWAGRLLPEDD